MADHWAAAWGYADNKDYDNNERLGWRDRWRENDRWHYYHNGDDNNDDGYNERWGWRGRWHDDDHWGDNRTNNIVYNYYNRGREYDDFYFYRCRFLEKFADELKEEIRGMHRTMDDYLADLRELRRERLSFSAFLSIC